MAEYQKDAKLIDCEVLGVVTGYIINLENFSKRLKMLYSHWNKHRNDLWGASEVLAIATPPPSQDLRYLKSSALSVWLLGYEFPDTIILFMKNQIHFLCSEKKACLLEAVRQSAKEVLGLEVVMHVKAESDDGTALMDSIFPAVRSQSKLDGHSVVGYLAREVPEGNLLDIWTRKLENSKFQLVDITDGLSDLFGIKDNAEVTNVKIAANLASWVIEFMVPKLTEVIDFEKQISVSSWMSEVQKIILKPAKDKGNGKVDIVGFCYPPILRSGEEFDFTPSALRNDLNLCIDSTSVIICAVGCRFNGYCSNVIRTLLIHASSMQKMAYEVLLKAHEAAIAALKPGNKASAVYQAALSIVEQDAPQMAANLTESAGTGIGIEFCEFGLSLDAKNDRMLNAGMVFNVSLGFQHLYAETSNPKTPNFTVLVADTVIVGKKSPEVATYAIKALKDVAFSFKGKEKVKTHANDALEIISEPTLSSVICELPEEQILWQHQAEHASEANEGTSRRLPGGGSEGADDHAGILEMITDDPEMLGFEEGQNKRARIGLD